MKELYIESTDGNTPIDQEMVKKYNLKKGTLSPFTINRIVGQKGDFSREDNDEENEPKELTKGDLENELILTTSEAIDIAEGADSITEQ